MILLRKKLKKVTARQAEGFSRALEENQAGFQDGIAMVLAAFWVIVLPCLLALLGLGTLILLLFGAIW